MTRKTSKRKTSKFLWKPHIWVSWGIYYMNPANPYQSVSSKAVARVKGFNILATEFVHIKNGTKQS